MSRVTIINQPAGLGDIFFCQKIAYHFNAINKCATLWPVLPHFLYVKDYLTAQKDNIINFISVDEFDKLKNNDSHFKYICDTCTLPLHGHTLLDSSVMKSKYKLVGLDWSDWKYYFRFQRNREKENQLYYDVLQLKDDEDYILVNNNFASPPDVQISKFSFERASHVKIIDMKIYEEFTLFDWCKVIINATSIVTVETSLNYLIEVLPIRAKNLVMVSKWNPPDFHHIEGLFKRPWLYHKK